MLQPKLFLSIIFVIIVVTVIFVVSVNFATIVGIPIAVLVTIVVVRLSPTFFRLSSSLPPCTIIIDCHRRISVLVKLKFTEDEYQYQC